MSEGDERGGPLAASSDVNLVLRFRIWGLLALLALTVLLSLGLKKIRMTPDPLRDLYPAGHPFLPALDAIQKMAPDSPMLVAVVETKNGDIYNAETIKKIDRITSGLMKIEGVLPGGIASLTKGMPHYEHTAEGLKDEPILGRRWPETSEEFEALKRRVAVNPMGLGRYVAYDGTAAMITASLEDVKGKAERSYRALSEKEKARESLGKYKDRMAEEFDARLVASLADLKSSEDDSRHAVHFMGEEVITGQMTAMGARHVPMAGGLMVLLILVLLAVHFRTWQGVLFPVMAMSLSLIWALGLVGWTGRPFNPMTLTFPVILGILTLVFATLAMDAQRLSRIENKGLAISVSYREAGWIVSILAAALLGTSLFLTQVPMIKELGRLTGFWLAGVLAMVMVANPILNSIFPARGRERDRSRGGVLESLANRSVRASIGSAGWFVILALIGVLGAGGFCMARLEVGDNVPGSSYIRPGHPWNRCFELFSKKFMGPYQLLVHVRAKQEGGLLEPEAVLAMGEFSSYLKDECGAKDSIALDMMIKMARLMLMDGNPKWETVPPSRKQVEKLAGLVLEQGGVESFIDKTFTEATISPFFPEADARRIDQFVAKARAYIEAHPSDRVEFNLGGGLMGMTKAVNDGTRDSYRRILVWAPLAALAIGTLATGSLLASIVVILPALGAIALEGLLMRLTGTPVSLPLVPTLAIGIGFGIALGLYLIRQMANQAKEAPDVQEGIRRGMAIAGGSVLFAGILAFAAALPWFFIGLKFQSQMVLAAGTTFLLEAIACVVFLPALARFARIDG